MSQKLQNWQFWILQNVQLLRNRYGKNNVVFDNTDWQSILIYNYSLPRSWRQLNTSLLIVLPLTTQIFYMPPDRFYIEK